MNSEMCLSPESLYTELRQLASGKGLKSGPVLRDLKVQEKTTYKTSR